MLPKVLGRLGPRVLFVFRHFPLTEAHPDALHAAEAAESVAAHAGEDAFWTMHDLLFEHQQDAEDALDDRHLLHYAEESGANPSDVERELETEEHEPAVKADFMGGVRSGVNGTPTFFINGRRYEGNWTDADAFAAALEEAAS
jgi:formate-nitrite transporter family protein